MKIMKISLGVALLISVTACGGGGGGGGGGDAKSITPVATNSVAASVAHSVSSSAVSSVTTSLSYSPDPTLKDSVASESKQLYVAESFTFSDSAVYKIRVSAKDSFGQPLTNSAIHFYSTYLDESTGEPAYIKGALEFTAYTDNFGDFYREIELPRVYRQLIVSVDAMGIEADKNVSLDSSEIMINFD